MNTIVDKDNIIYSIQYLNNNKRYNINLLGKLYEKYKNIFDKIEKEKNTKSLLKNEIKQLEELFGKNYMNYL